MRATILILSAAAMLALPAQAARPVKPVKPMTVPAAVYTDPAPDKAHPARMEVLHIPSGGVEINGVAYLASGAGPHPTLVLCHGWPGNEKNLDLAQAVRRAGWNVVTFNYRGSWGSPGSFRFAQNPEDARAVLTFLRDPANAARLGVDTRRMAIMGHSMGGWVTAMVAGQDDGLLGAGLISAANMGMLGKMDRAEVIKRSAGNSETLADTSPERMADELIANSDANNFMPMAPGLAKKSLLILSSDDGLAPGTDKLGAAVRAAGGKRVTMIHVATDHSWSDKRVMLQAQVIRWLQGLLAGKPR
ncbi:alpha/beta fold hydrolase [Novosphingobium sp.]|uniref:alpha/beta hydrolase family protein n=1 Tax=Novosphingobium sp. TaxID=1874826 RepID=UPI0025FB34ED|nr:alpha/beta fold hydrolase [Novosphingobium sp.]